MNWLTLVHKAADDTSITQVAARLKVSRTTLSLVLADKYPAKTDRIAARVLEVYGRVQCPFLGMEIAQAECRSHQSRSVPTSSPRELRHWRACQTCPTGSTLRKGQPSCSTTAC